MATEKAKKSIYISARAIRDLHIVIFLFGNYLYWDWYYGFNNGLYSMPTFLEMLPFSIGWTLTLIGHMLLVRQIHAKNEEIEALNKELEERKLVENITARLHADGELREFYEIEEIIEEKPKHNHKV